MPQETHYIRDLHFPHTRLRFHIETQGGDVIAFVVKLEYNLGHEPLAKNDWRPVARFDHNQYSEDGHDIRDEGLHIDICDVAGRKIERRQGFPESPPNKAVGYCEEHFNKFGHVYAERFERRANIDGRWNTP